MIQAAGCDMRALLLLAILSSHHLAAEDALEPAPGRFLVAKRTLGDPNFHQTVILMLRFDDKGALGLVVNDPTKIPLSKLFDQIAGARERADVLYLGGPVQRSVVHGLLRSKTKPESGTHLFGDVYMAASKTFIEQALRSAVPTESLRIYLGYSGWGAGQLERELERGAWHVVRGDADAIFAAKPDGVWERMIRKTELRFAMGDFNFSISHGN
jgi:putative transcriptional regulator